MKLWVPCSWTLVLVGMCQEILGGGEGRMKDGVGEEACSEAWLTTLTVRPALARQAPKCGNAISASAGALWARGPPPGSGCGACVAGAAPPHTPSRVSCRPGWRQENCQSGS